MPFYLFENEDSGEVKEFFVKISDIKNFSPGIGWRRVYTVPYVSTDSNIDPYSPKDFIEKTRSKKGTIGDLFDKSRELSEARGGEKRDPVVKQFFSDYEKTKGIKHACQIQAEKKEKLTENLKKFGVSSK
jgi:hypothetical protein